MKKSFFLFIAMCAAHCSFAICVTTKQIGTNYAEKTVTFALAWNGCDNVAHLNRVWCFVDFCSGNANGSKGAWTRATISGTPGVANGTYAAGNTAGFYVTGTNGQSATVTVKLGNAPAMFDWCAFATDFPPNSGKANGTYVLKGTPPFRITTKSGTYSLPTAAYSGTDCITAITDATGYPGIPYGTAARPASPDGCCDGSVLYDKKCIARNTAVCNNVPIIEIANTYKTGITWANRNQCPSGWRIPNAAEWKCMYAFFYSYNYLPDNYYLMKEGSSYEASGWANNAYYWWLVMLWHPTSFSVGNSVGNCYGGQTCRQGWYYDYQSASNLLCIR